MKKTILLIAALLGSITAHAAGDTQLWGYVPNDFTALNGHGFSTQNMFGAAVRLTVDDMFDGSLITGIDVPFNTEEAWEVTAFVASADDIDTPLTSTFSDEGTVVGYNTYTFSQPYRLEKGKDVYVGYTFRIISTATKEEKAPILTGGVAKKGGLMVYNKKEWADYSAEGWGNSGLQVHIQGATLPPDNASIVNVFDFGGGINSSSTLQAVVSGNSANAIHTLGYSVSMGGQTTQGTANVNIAPGFNKQATIDIAVPTPAEVGTYPATVTLQTVNGQPVAPTSATATATIYIRQVPRYTVMEEHTGTGCQHCTRGWAGMEYMKTHFDRYIAISNHQHNQDDAMYNQNYPPLGLSAAPSCLIDRKTKSLDPLYGSDEEKFIIADFERWNAVMPEVEVHADGRLQPDGQSVEAVVDVDFLNHCPDCTVFYAITADGLTCPENPDAKTLHMWEQANVFAKMETRNHYRGDGSCEIRNLYAEFAEGGKYGSTKLTNLVFNDVLIGSSYSTAGGSATDALPAEGKAGTTARTARTVQITCNEYGRAALRYDQIYLVALVLDAKGQVANAARVKVQMPEGIGAVLDTSAGTLSTTQYELSGRRLTAPHGQGIYIQNRKTYLAH